MKGAIVILMLAIMIIPVVSADVITPGFEPTSIENKITNINDYPDYFFLSANAPSEFGPGYGMCNIKIIKEDGLIYGGYKFCQVSVYAVKKIDINLSDYDENGFYIYQNKNDTEIGEYFDSLNAKEVIKNIDHYTEVFILNPIIPGENSYTIDLNEVKDKPDKKGIAINPLYLYILIPLLALVIIIYIFIKRRRK